MEPMRLDGVKRGGTYINGNMRDFVGVEGQRNVASAWGCAAAIDSVLIDNKSPLDVDLNRIWAGQVSIKLGNTRNVSRDLGGGGCGHIGKGKRR